MEQHETAVRAARAAGDILRASAGARQVHHKGDVDLVTEVDLACEEAVRAVLERECPGVTILGEEGGGQLDATCWVVDPLDGTTNFVHGFPYYAVSIGLIVDGVPTVGVVYDPSRDAMYEGFRGGGARCNGRPLQVSETSVLEQALLGTGFPYDRHEHADAYLALFRAFLVRARGVRRPGAAALDLAMVAAGCLDGFWELGLKPWDVAAGVLLITEAGGQVSQVDGGPLALEAPVPLASNGRLHDAMVGVARASGVRVA